MQEIVLALGEIIMQKILAEMKLSPVFSLLIDEMTDIAVAKHLIINARYIH